MQAIILAGGLGTRVKELTRNKIPKPMLRVNGRPFLEYILDWLLTQGTEEIIFAIGFKGEVITQHFKDNYKGIDIRYSYEEDNLLGTGGAIKKALACCDENTIFAVNGDTYFPVDIRDLLAWHRKKHSEITIALKHLYNFDRFGTVEINADTKITRFREKGFTKEGFINGGIYCIDKEILLDYKKDQFSLERDFLEGNIKDLKILGKVYDDAFYDIGTPADYEYFSEAMSHV
ncbi:MAG: hypothetical protein A3K14_03745 [Sulfurimonas sp. RIFCSPLOWO2_12_FULL_36_74]|nr:MAG: hypothetical protein A3K14_03745 [Sulfurimonas sp. RIFCSPLOWO2_12_FULL_36_74]